MEEGSVVVKGGPLVLKFNNLSKKLEYYSSVIKGGNWYHINPDTMYWETFIWVKPNLRNESDFKKKRILNDNCLIPGHHHKKGHGDSHHGTNNRLLHSSFACGLLDQVNNRHSLDQKFQNFLKVALIK